MPLTPDNPSYLILERSHVGFVRRPTYGKNGLCQRRLASFSFAAESGPDYICFRLQPELDVSARRAAVLLPKFVGPRSDLLLKPPCSKAPLQLLFQFLNKPPEALRCRLVTDVGSKPPCSFDLPLQFAKLFILIHAALSNSSARTTAHSVINES
jgi:hypothetical protein